MSSKKELVEALCKEISLQSQFINSDPIETIYFGGGTPSLLDDSEMAKIWLSLHQHLDLASLAEVTLEANPDDLNPFKLESLRASGINRLSIGVQSFHDPHLQFMNRSHLGHQAVESIENARRAGFDNISIDLIYAIPSPTHEVWIRDLERALELSPEHISAYCLTIEDKTAFGRWQKTGKLKPVDEPFAADQFEILIETLEKRGFDQYEISNFARNGGYAKHNTSYWQQKKYLGIGPSAHSFNGSWRQYNVSNNARYIKAIKEGVVPFEREELSDSDRFNEYLLTSIRTKWGTNLSYGLREFGVDVEKLNAAALDLLQKEGLLFVSDSTLYLTKKGKLLADEITSRLMIF